MQGWLSGVVRRYRFLERYPYHADVLSRLVPVSDQRVHAMAVSRDGNRVRLHVNPSVLRGRSG